MKIFVNILLSIWLIATGLVALGAIHFHSSGVILPVLGVVTGILFLFVGSSEKLVPRMGNILLGLWLLIGGLLPLLQLRFSGSGIVLAVLSIAAGVLTVVRR